MKLRSVHTTFHHLGEEKQQMLGLNRRLESYLSRVKLLEEENMLLVKELEALRRSSHGALTQRKAMEEELRQARLEVEAAWRDRTLTELEVCRLSEELQALNLQTQMEAEERVNARTAVEQSRKELEEEQRAQMWLRQKISQLEEEMTNLVQTHQENVANLEVNISQSRVALPPMLAQKANQGTSVLQLGQEYHQKASKAWQEATEAYQGQLARLEETLEQTRSRLVLVCQERNTSQLRLRALEKEMASAEDVKVHLEKTVVQRRMEYDQEIQHLQEHLAALEGEKMELAQQMDLLVQENHGLLQAKMSMGLEVATYRALLDGENLRDISSSSALLNQPRKISGAAFGFQGVKRNYQSQQSPNPKNTTISTASTVFPSLHGQTASATIAATSPVQSRETAFANQNIPTIQTGKNSMNSKILHRGTFEDFKPQEAQEEVAHAEALSPTPAQEVPAEATSKGQEGEGRREDLEPPEVMDQVQFSLGSEPLVHDEVIHHQQVTPNLTPYHIRMKDEFHGSSDESDNDFPSYKPASLMTKHEEEQKLSGMNNAPAKKEEETSDSETEAVIELHSESRTSSPLSEYEPEERNSASNEGMDLSREERKMTDGDQDVGRITQEADVEERLYPDGEEMDTWDSVMEKRVDLKSGDSGLKQDKDAHQHAEPEEDISARLQEMKEKDFAQVDGDEQRVEAHPVVYTADNMSPADSNLPHHDEDEEEDSQNISMSWKTEVEGISDAQDNTLADTRPLIRYKSDEADANTQASHADDSESSNEAEQEKKKTGELRSWAEGKTQRSGTMEDLCEEVEEEEVLDEQYQLRYTHLEDRDTALTKTEDVVEVRAEEVIQDKEKHEGSEEPAQSVVSPEPDVKQENDRLVEQEMENLDMFSYSVHLSQQQVSATEVTAEKGEEDIAARPECEDRTNQQLRSLTSIDDQPDENPSFRNTPEAQPQGPETLQSKEWEEENSVSTVTKVDETEDAFISRSDLEEVLVQHLQRGFVLSEAGGPAMETSNEFLESFKEDRADKPIQDFEQDENETRGENAVEPATGSPQHEEDQPLHKLPELEPSDIFEVRDSPEVLKTNGTGHDLHALLSAGLKKDFWTSSLETGATYQPNDPSDEEAKPVSQNLVTWTSTTMGKVQEEEQEIQAGAKPVPCRNTVQAEFVHSEDSDVEAESWSSGEEPV